jgi:membrane protein DedA with SNARE-associated domain
VPSGVVLFLVTSVFVAGLAHFLIKRYLIASGTSALVSPCAFALACAVLGEQIQVPELKVFLLFASIGLLIALAVGLAFVISRRVANAF